MKKRSGCQLYVFFFGLMHKAHVHSIDCWLLIIGTMVIASGSGHQGAQISNSSQMGVFFVQFGIKMTKIWYGGAKTSVLLEPLASR